MSFWNKIPFLSLNLLIITYTLFGWSVAEATSKLWIWLTFAGIIILLIFILAGPIGQFRNVFTVWLQSDATAFLSILVFAFVTVILVTRLDLLVQWLVLLAPGYLACLDLQRSHYQPWTTFAIVLVLALSGYGAGILLQQQFGQLFSGVSL